ncbi:mechanosensitive ion channel family protein [Kerstersia gyiorum]|uniref:Small-conductance mechanosensitive channel n=1 Tax=Kerstersia gyiorum TaxID=206506 RepID=A0A171KSX4_9BURK|nr:mechanosensitive ion channel domain-containing protein [Kerstersia gyiorum]KKO71991.1 mechanosensitive ion channel protein MscS [Kerstersia gyiorum]
MSDSVSKAILESQAYGFAITLLIAAVILIVGWWVSKWVGSMVRRAATSSPRIDATIVPILSSTAVWAIRVFTLVAVLARFGVQTASIIAVLGAAGLAIGLALQNTLQNIAAGVMLLALRPMRAGEYVSVGGVNEGTVEEIGLFMTRLTQFDGIAISLPNSTVWGANLINYSRNPTRRLDLEAQVRYNDDLDAAVESLKALINDHPLVSKEPAPMVMVMGYRDNGVSINVRVWTDNSKYWELRWDLLYKIRKTLVGAGMGAAVPVRELQGPVVAKERQQG